MKKHNPFDFIGPLTYWLEWEIKNNEELTKDKKIELLNIMYNYKKATPTSLSINTSTQGETIEEKIERVVNNKEPITDSAPIIYTERKDGIIPGYDVRTDKWEIAVEGMDKVTKTKIAKREERHKQQNEDTKIIDINKEKPNNNQGGEGVN